MRKSIEKNIKIYPFYRAFSYDFLFLWTISIMYLTFKGLSYSQTIFLDAIFMFSAFIFQIPMTKAIHKIGKVNSMKIASVLCILFSLIFLFMEGFIWFAIANVFYGISSAIKNVADSEILSVSLKKLNRAKEYSYYEGRGTFWHYTIESISAIISGYLFQYVSPYAPIVCTLTCSIILMVLTLFLTEVNDDDCVGEIEKAKLKHNKSLHLQHGNLSKFVFYTKKEKKQRKPRKTTSYKLLLKDKFVLSMMVFCFSYYGIMSVYSSLAKIYYQDINTKAWMFGYIFFFFKIISALSSKYQFKFELKRGLRSLIIFAILCVLTFGVNGIVALINPTAIISIIIITIMFVIQNAIRAPYRIFVKNYINISCTKANLSKTLTLYSMAECLGYALITLVTALVLGATDNNFALTNIVITAIVFLPLMISIIIFIRELVKKYSKKYTKIRADMKEDI